MLSRRRFAKGMGASLVMATQIPQSAMSQSVSGGRRRLIVDAQAHLWKANTPDLPWVAGAKPPGPTETFTIERLLGMMDDAGVDRVVVVPPTLTGTRNDYGLEAAKRYPKRFAVMGRFPIDDPKAAELLPHWKDKAGMLGIRTTFQGESGKRLKAQAYDWFWAAAETSAVPVMFLAPGLLPDFAHIAERHPQLTLIIDHIAMNPSIPIAQSATDTIALARYSNVSVKMKAGAQYEAEPYPYRNMNVQLQRVFEAYGPQRCHWETDITQTLNDGGYKHRIAQFTEELKFLSEDDKDWIMGRAILARLHWAPASGAD
jgi:predicted TIM-barrel fold metal-dependent hydrolase